jgi:phospholipid/cholesterol/gamma-HCH transport system ATP-binding protein
MTTIEKEIVELELRDVMKQFPKAEKPTLNGMSLKVFKGSIHVLLGHSGSGKSVTLKHLLGLLEPDGGVVQVKGHNIGEISAVDHNELQKKFGMLFQSSALFDSLTVKENVAFPLREHRPDLSEGEILERVEFLLESVQLPRALNKLPSELSGGMRKRVGLARAIALNPEILFYDEPTTGLDPETARVIDDLIADTSRKLNATSLIISHDIHAALRIGDFVSMIWEGRVIESASPTEFLRSENPVVRNFLKSAGAI